MATWRHRSEGGFDPSLYHVDAIDRSDARRYVVAHHYSGSYVADRMRFGLFRSATLVGVAVLGVPVHPAVLPNVFPTLEPYAESLELSRFVLDDACESNSETWFLARVFEEAAARGLRGVLSFSDPVPRVVGGRVLFPGHIGIIYQASNAVYTGRSAPHGVVLLPSGEVLHSRALSKVRRQERGHEQVERRLVALGARPPGLTDSPASWLVEALDAVGAVRLHHGGCHRYAFTLGTRRDRRATPVALPQHPYPKQLAGPGTA